jgi:hypothetical protein
MESQAMKEINKKHLEYATTSIFEYAQYAK